jgi:CheY-like chemotaxis protein
MKPGESENQADNGSQAGAEERILLVDDDPVFGRILCRVGARSGASVTFCQSLDALGGEPWQRFDAAIVDFDLGTATGIELIRQLERVLGELPVILVSQSREVAVPPNQWPRAIRGFLHKSLGPGAILQCALGACPRRDRSGHRVPAAVRSAQRGVR